MIPYPGWSVVYGEIPAASKWSQLGANDDALANGTGLDDLSIAARHYQAGSITPVKWNNPYTFSAYLATSVSLSSGVWTKAPMATELFDNNGNFDTATNRYIATITGDYIFSAQVSISSSGMGSTEYGEGALYKNGARVVAGHRQTGSGSSTTMPRIRLDTIEHMVAGDYMEVYGFCNVGTRHIDGGRGITFMTGCLVTPR